MHLDAGRRDHGIPEFHERRPDPDSTGTGSRSRRALSSTAPAPGRALATGRAALGSLLAVLLSGCVLAKPPNPALFEFSEELLYYSDYFSFVGEDRHGKVAFALDTNRGLDGDRWQAEHFVVLHAEHAGWVDIVGSGDYPNRERRVKSIPDSEFFQFQGNAERGFYISSATNRLTLQTRPIPTRLSRTHLDAEYRMGSAPATLQWNQRLLSGRVIYEFLAIPGFNRLSRDYPGLWQDFHGVYARVGNAGDLYWHTQQSPLLAPLMGRVDGFLHLKGRTQVLDGLDVEVMKREQAAGSYRWPTVWFGQWAPAKRFALHSTAHVVIANWVTGGFAMSVVRGRLELEAETYDVYGLGELLI